MSDSTEYLIIYTKKVMTDIKNLVSPEEHTSQMVVQSSASSDLDSCLQTAAGQLWCFTQSHRPRLDPDPAETLGTDWDVQQVLDKVQYEFCIVLAVKIQIPFFRTEKKPNKLLSSLSYLCDGFFKVNV